MKALVISTVVCLSFGLLAQDDWTADDSIKGQRMIETIEQSLMHFYQDHAPRGNYDSIIELLEAETAEMPTFSDSVYCERLNKMNEMSPFHLDCNQHTLKTIKFFVEKRRGFSRVVLGRSALYFDMYEEKLAKHDMPIELKYLSVIESGLRPQVKSRAGALGLWQFMYSTGKMYDLKVNSYVDDRNDPLKSTEAACQYMLKMYDVFEDWNLVLAAYNSGPGNVRKAIRRSGGKTSYWEIRPFLPRETSAYVPLFIAATYAMEYGHMYGVGPADIPAYYIETDTVRVTNQLHFQQVEQQLSVAPELLEFLNPQYRYKIIPVVDGADYFITLPKESAVAFRAQQDSIYAVAASYFESRASTMPEFTQMNERTTHRVKSGETLGHIAGKYGVGVSEIKRWNGLTSDKIRVGQRIVVYPRRI